MKQIPTDASDKNVMLDDWHPVPYSERASQHITVGAYIQRGLFKILVGGASGTVIGWAMDRAWPNAHGRLKALGGVIGGLVGGYFTWNRTETAQLQMAEIQQEYKDLPGMLPSNQELVVDNEMLRQMTAYQHSTNHSSVTMPGATIHADADAHEGMIHATSKTTELN